ncbi:MAG: SCO family protein [Acidimicrobiia bacterium]
MRKALSLAGLVVLLLGTTAACTATGTPTTIGSIFDGTVLEPPEPKPEFVLTDTQGQPFDFTTETEGKLTLLYFGYTFCPDICPVQLAQLAAVMDRLPDVERNSVVVFVTVDPERDTPEVIRTFLDNFNSTFVGLTGTVDQVEAAQRAAGVPVAVKIGDGADYSMGHASQVIAYAPDGLAYTEYPYGTRQTQWVHDLPLIMDKP